MLEINRSDPDVDSKLGVNNCIYLYKNVLFTGKIRFNEKMYFTKYKYCKDGLLHREDGPAVIFYDDATKDSIYYFNGIRVNCNNQKEFERQIKLWAFK